MFHWGDIVEKVLSKVRDSKKKIKAGDGHIGRGVSIEGVGSNLLHTMAKEQKKFCLRLLRQTKSLQ